MKKFDWFKRNYWLLLILFAASALRFYHLDFQSLWLDEVLSMNDANPKLTYSQFYDSVLFWEAFPHLYFLLLKYVLAIFGYTSWVARAFSATIGVFGVYAMYLLGKELFSKRAGLIVSAITAVNIFHISHSQEVRPYGLLFLFTVLAFYRLAILIRVPNYKNAIVYGVFAGLIVNAHFIGLLAVFSQFLLLLFFLLKTEPELRKGFFICSLIAGIVTTVFVLPTYSAFLKLSEIKDFWVPKPTSDAFTLMFSEFFGNSEMVLFLVNIIVVFLFVTLFKQPRVRDKFDIITNKLIFSFIILGVWLIISLVIPIVKSYLDLSIILTRYFINVLPVLLVAVAIGVDQIKNSVVRNFIIAYFLIMSLLNLFVIKGYYSIHTKTQFREVAAAIKEKNFNKSKIVVFWGWIFPYFFQDESDVKIEQFSLENYVVGMKNNTINPTSFWYADANSRPYLLSPESQAYLDQHYVIKDSVEFYDAWAKYFMLKDEIVSSQKSSLILDSQIDLNLFSKVSFGNDGSLLMFENTNTITPFFHFKKGSYQLIIKGNSLPAKPIDGENAHLKVKINGKEIGNFFMSNEPTGKEQYIPFQIDRDKEIRLQLIFDNDVLKNGQDRNLIISSIRIQKQ